MSRITKRGKLAIEFIHAYPQMSQKALGKLLYEKYPTIFNSGEDARNMIRTHLGTRTKTVKAKGELNKNFSPQNPYGIPEGEHEDRKFTQIQAKRILWLSDIHFPNHDQKALTTALNWGKQNKCDCIVIGGDLLDNQPFTSHLSPPPIYSDVRRWFDMVDDFLDMLLDKFKVPVHFMEGNHDAWYKRYLMQKSPAIFHDEYYTLQSRLRLREKGITWHPENTVVMAGKLPMTHGHMIVKGVFAPVNPARGVFNKIKSSMLIGHCHQTSEHSESNLDGNVITTYSTGCLCTLSNDYDPFNTKHNLGFAFIEVGDKGTYRVHNKRIDTKTKEVY